MATHSLQRRFAAELSLWGTSDEVRLVTIATFGLGATGLPSIVELSLQTLSAQWLPVEDVFELNLVDQLVSNERRFIKGLRYGLSRRAPLVNATLIDAAVSPISMRVLRAGDSDASWAKTEPPDRSATWVWRVTDGPMRTFPASSTRLPAGTKAQSA